MSSLTQVELPAKTLQGIERARERVIAERRRAARSAEIAARHEQLAATAPDALRQFHQGAATSNRQMEARHLVAAGIQASHVARLRSWVRSMTLASRPGEPPHRDGGQFGLVVDEREGLGRQATHDPLTDLPNRLQFAERLAVAMEPADPTQSSDVELPRLAVCLINLDNFEGVTRRLGREVGDHILVALARRLTERLPKRFLARLGDAEFAVLVQGIAGPDEAIAVADMLLGAIREPVSVNGQELTVSACIGVVEPLAGPADPIELMRAADIALGWAKSEGPGHRMVFDSGRSDEEMTRHALTAALPAAINRGELVVEYQPIVSLSDGVVAGVEALVRWRHPELGLLPPGRFIDLAEESGMIVQLGRDVLVRSCHEAARWMKITPNPPYVSVNVSARQLHESDIVRAVASVLEESGLPASQLTLEVTEGAIVRPDGQSITTLHRLVALGISIAIDDFGTGYSNLSYLRQLPVQVTKIDRAFISALYPPDGGPDVSDVLILSAMVSLAHVLGLSVIAEGVETAAQAEQLQSLGCDSAQGWHFGRPTSAEEIEAIIAAGA